MSDIELKEFIKGRLTTFTTPVLEDLSNLIDFELWERASLTDLDLPEEYANRWNNEPEVFDEEFGTDGLEDL